MVIGHEASFDRTGFVSRFQRSALVGGGESFCPSHIERNRSSVKYDGDDVGITCDTAHRLDRQFGAERGSTYSGSAVCVGLVGADSVLQRFKVDVHDEFGPHWTITSNDRCASAANEFK